MRYKIEKNLNSDDYVQEFSSIEKEYKLDDKKMVLVEIGEIDLQEQLNSNLSCALDKILDKFLDLPSLNLAPNVAQTDEIYDCVHSDLADLAEIYSRADEYKEKFNLDLNLSPSEVFKVLEQKASKLGDDLNNFAKNLEKGSEDDGKTQTNEQEK